MTEEVKKSNRGGKREGAGRKPKSEDQKTDRRTRSLRLSGLEYEKVKEFLELIRNK